MNTIDPQPNACRIGGEQTCLRLLRPLSISIPIDEDGKPIRAGGKPKLIGDELETIDHVCPQTMVYSIQRWIDRNSPPVHGEPPQYIPISNGRFVENLNKWSLPYPVRFHGETRNSKSVIGHDGELYMVLQQWI